MRSEPSGRERAHAVATPIVANESTVAVGQMDGLISLITCANGVSIVDTPPMSKPNDRRLGILLIDCVSALSMVYFVLSSATDAANEVAAPPNKSANAVLSTNSGASVCATTGTVSVVAIPQPAVR